MSDTVVCFKLISGNHIAGKLSTEKTHPSFVDFPGVIYLEDAVLIGLQEMGDGNIGLGMGPISDMGEMPEEGKAKMPFSLFQNVVLGQVPLSREIDLMYRNATSRIALIR